MNHLTVPIKRVYDADRERRYPNAPSTPAWAEPDHGEVYKLYIAYQLEFEIAIATYTTACEAAGVNVVHNIAHNILHVNKTLRYLAEEVALACLS